MAAYRAHAGGQWSGMSAEQRFEVTRRFLTDFAAHASPSRARDLVRGISAAWADTIACLAGAGDVGGMRRSARRVAELALARQGRTFMAGAAREVAERLRKRLR
jgi:hypothetical protein